MSARLNNLTPGCEDFRSADFLRSHMRTLMDFYDTRASDASGGMHQFLFSDGTLGDTSTRHLVSAARYVVSYAMLYQATREPRYRSGAERAVAFLRSAFLDTDTGGYAWVIHWGNGQAHARDTTRHAYGMAFVMLAYAHAAICGIEGAAKWLDETFHTAERHLWEPHAGLYADEASASWTLSAYRGQNANMHTCEAMIAAYRATGNARYLERAETLAQSVTQRLAAPTGGLIWEHYDSDWTADWAYNRAGSQDKYRTWGYQPGHFTEWAKLLLSLDRDCHAPWHLRRAIELFDAATTRGWDLAHGGFFSALSPDGSVFDANKCHWAQGESLAAAALLARGTGAAKYWDWYDRIWAYCWAWLIDHEHGAWRSLLTAANGQPTPGKQRVSAAGYHTIGACHDVLAALGKS